jgi:8-oxo-dGTP diphosphatase
MQALHVAVGVILDADKRILISRRADEAHQGGLWEFPGGKVEATESVEVALARELFEELGIQIEDICPLVRVEHDYSDKSVVLDVWVVPAFTGIPTGREGQPLAWATLQDLERYSFPDANAPIIEAVKKLLSC